MNIRDITERLLKIIKSGADSTPTMLEIIELELNEFVCSQKRRIMLDGIRYYEGRHDIFDKKNLYKNGLNATVELDYLPNSKLVDNQYKKMVVQKTNYLVGKPIAFDTDNAEYSNCLKELFNEKFNKTLKNICKDTLNCGIGWCFLYINDLGKLDFKRFLPTEIVPFWADDEHTELEFAVRYFDTVVYEGTKKTIQHNVEVYTLNGVDYFIYQNGKLIEDVTKEHSAYLYADTGDAQEAYNWAKIPLIPFKYNDEEMPLIVSVKSLQDGINQVLSNYQDNMLQNPANTILILKNYDGQDLTEFREKLIRHGVIKIRSVNGIDGGVDTLTVNVDSNNYRTILELLKKSLIENAMGYDAKDDRIGSNANQMNIQSMYNDIDLDADGMETEFQASLKRILWFVNQYLANTGKGDFEGERVRIIFNRDMMMNESEIMNMLLQAGLRLSQKTLISQVPFIDDVQQELERVAEEDEQVNDYEHLGGGAIDT